MKIIKRKKNNNKRSNNKTLFYPTHPITKGAPEVKI